MLIFLFLFFLQVFILYCCILLGKKSPKDNTYEDQAQNKYIDEWKRGHSIKKKRN